MVRVDFVASVARVTSIAIVASTFYNLVFRQRVFYQRRSMFVAVALRPTITSSIAVAAKRFIVTSVASVASRSTVGVMTSIVVASIVVATAIRLALVVSPAIALACLVMRVIRAMHLPLLAKALCARPLGSIL